jgi:hypothetical protein
LGKGNVEVVGNGSLWILAECAIAPDATLPLTGTKAARAPSNMTLDADNTVAGLIFDGEKQSAGTWGAEGSGAENEHENFSGAGILTVDR